MESRATLTELLSCEEKDKILSLTNGHNSAHVSNQIGTGSPQVSWQSFPLQSTFARNHLFFPFLFTFCLQLDCAMQTY